MLLTSLREQIGRINLGGKNEFNFRKINTEAVVEGSHSTRVT